MYASGDSPQQIVAREGLAMVSDNSLIEETIAAIFAANPAELTRYRAGEEKLFGFFMGQVMRATQGKADPAAAKARLTELIRPPG
jgi:aspartyl-tRNA(Asn)/glutamyl-tRNA(Gln) amidotransferase subunit B